jgi:hypothetical protein
MFTRSKAAVSAVLWPGPLLQQSYAHYLQWLPQAPAVTLRVAVHMAAALLAAMPAGLALAPPAINRFVTLDYVEYRTTFKPFTEVKWAPLQQRNRQCNRTLKAVCLACLRIHNVEVLCYHQQHQQQRTGSSTEFCPDQLHTSWRIVCTMLVVQPLVAWASCHMAVLLLRHCLLPQVPHHCQDLGHPETRDHQGH